MSLRSRPTSAASQRDSQRETEGKSESRERSSTLASQASGTTAVSAASTSTPRRLGLPPVKGTVGAIESPRRRGFGFDDSPAPTSPFAQSPVPAGIAASSSSSTTAHFNTPAPPSIPTFRADPTMRTCFDTVPLDRRDELKRLFGV